MAKKQLGSIISGSLTEGFLMRIVSDAPLHEIKTGKFVSVQSGPYKFFSLITDLALEVTNPDILLFPPTSEEPLLMDALKKKDMYATAQLRPMLMLDQANEKMPVKTIPGHFSTVYEANRADVNLIFGDEHDASKRYFNIGCPLDMDTPVCIDLERLCERSNGIFGKSGTGKTFLTRLILAGTIKQEKASVLIFDMHSEYGIQARKEGGPFVKGLKTLFPDKVALFSLDPQSTRRRGGMPDVEIVIPYSAINVEDVISLQDELNLHATALEAAYLIYARHKRDWLEVLLNQGDRLKEFAQELGAHPESIAALYRKLKRLERLPFLQPSTRRTQENPSPLDTFAPQTLGVSGSVGGEKKPIAAARLDKENVIDQMLEYIDKGMSIIVEFGNYTGTFVYLLIANIITRRIHARYIEKTEKYLGSQQLSDEPKKLMICIEEAHKFLNPSAARQTIFGTIAREMRKYYVSLLVVDQRPSGIDEEVLSQIGTKVVAQLNDEKDIQAVLTGISGANNLRSILASLDTKKQALLLGHAVAMPVVVQTREYDENFYRAMGPEVSSKQITQLIDELF